MDVCVITVPAVDWNGAMHTAYTVHGDIDGILGISSGWTLKDALDFFARDYGFDKDSLKVRRPFKPQSRHILRHKAQLSLDG